MIRYYKSTDDDIIIIRRLSNVLDEHYNPCPDKAEIYENCEWKSRGSFYLLNYSLIPISEAEAMLELL